MARHQIQIAGSYDDLGIKIPERGSVYLGKQAWSKLESEKGFQTLVAAGKVEVGYRHGGTVKLTTSCYVGRASFNGITIEIVEKVPGSVLALLKFTTSSSFRIESVSAPASELGGLILHIIHHFILLVGRYVSRQRKFEYVVEEKIASLAGGRLDINRTIRLHARGLRHLLAFEKTTISFDSDANRVLLAALREIGKLSKIVQVNAEEVSRARGLALLLSENQCTELQFASRAGLARLAQKLIVEEPSAEVRDLLVFAGIVLSHESFELLSISRDTVPISWFLNIQNLFEKAVLEVLRKLLNASLTVRRGAEHRRGVFKPQTGEYKAYPDIAVSDANRFVAIGDVKYKNWTGRAAASDVYQILVHASVFESQKCFLVFASDRFEMRYLGKASTDSDMWIFSVDIANLCRDLALVIAKLGINETRE